MKIYTPAEAQQKFLSLKHRHQASYFAMYSSWLGGIVTDPSLMLVPVDDHIVHRGDGVFEAIKCIQGRPYLFDEHLQRLSLSAQSIALSLPYELAELKKIILETVKASGHNDVMLRIFVSRGPGTFGTNPYDSVGSQLYVIATDFKPLSNEKYQKGVLIGRSRIPPKEEWLAVIKSCNYLPNVMMKKEAVDRALDFVVSFDGHGFLTEGSTENIMIVSKENILCKPRKKQILAGTMMNRCFELTQKHKIPELQGLQEKDISEKDLQQAREVMMVGTTLDVLPVTEFEKQKIADGQVGPVAKKLRELLLQDQISN